MRRFFKKAARALRARRELVTVAAVAIIAAVLIGGGQATLAAIVAAGAAGLMTGHAKRYRLAARDARRQVSELREELTESDNCFSLLSRLAQEREEDLSWIERQARLSLADSRKIIDDYRIFLKGGEEASPLLRSLFSEALKEWSNINDGLETVINNVGQELVGEQTQLADLYDTEEVNATDTATAEE